MAEKLPITWRGAKIVAGEQRWPAKDHVPALIYPNPLWKEDDTIVSGAKGQLGLQKSRYLVVNSGLTFREAHDKTNSQQKPKLPDWAVIDLTKLPDGKSPGRIVAADFFDEQWQLKK